MQPEKQFDLWNEKDLKTEHSYIELGPVADDADDHTQGWRENRVNFRIKIKREALISAEIRVNCKRNVWQVEAECNGYPVAITLYFQNGKEAKLIYDRLDKYIFG